MHIMHIEDLEVTQLRLVEALLESGSLTAAAHRIGLSQSAASHSLARLRDQLGDQLFVRTGNGMQPTPYGDQLSDSVRQALNMMRRSLSRRSEFDARTSTRHFNICMSDVGQLLLLPALLARIESVAPRISIRVSPVPAVQQSNVFESGEVDLAVGYFTTLTAGFRQKHLFTGHYVSLVREGHPAFLKGMSVDAFCSVPHAFAESSGMGHAQIYRMLEHRIRIPHIKVFVPHFIALPRTLSRTNLLAITPEPAALLFAKHAPLQILPLPVEVPEFVIKLYWHNHYHHDPGIAWLRGMFAKLIT
jgi:DNA-binding transcriptional LysR family regulator